MCNFSDKLLIFYWTDNERFLQVSGCPTRWQGVGCIRRGIWCKIKLEVKGWFSRLDFRRERKIQEYVGWSGRVSPGEREWWLELHVGTEVMRRCWGDMMLRRETQKADGSEFWEKGGKAVVNMYFKKRAWHRMMYRMKEGAHGWILWCNLNETGNCEVLSEGNKKVTLDSSLWDDFGH